MSAPEAGYQLDLQILSRVFGRRLLTYAEMRDEAESVWKAQPSCVYFSSLGGFTAHGRDRFSQACPKYSTDIAAAWLAVEKMIAGGWFPEVQFNNWGEESWNASFSRLTSDPVAGFVSRHRNTAPLAICCAALAAVEALTPLQPAIQAGGAT